MPMWFKFMWFMSARFMCTWFMFMLVYTTLVHPMLVLRLGSQKIHGVMAKSTSAHSLFLCTKLLVIIPNSACIHLHHDAAQFLGAFCLKILIILLAILYCTSEKSTLMYLGGSAGVYQLAFMNKYIYLYMNMIMK